MTDHSNATQPDPGKRHPRCGRCLSPPARGYPLGAGLGMLAFSLTLPAHPESPSPSSNSTVVGLGRRRRRRAARHRLLLAARARGHLPRRRQWRGLAIVALGLRHRLPRCSGALAPDPWCPGAAAWRGSFVGAAAGGDRDHGGAARPGEGGRRPPSGLAALRRPRRGGPCSRWAQGAGAAAARRSPHPRRPSLLGRASAIAEGGAPPPVAPASSAGGRSSRGPPRAQALPALVPVVVWRIAEAGPRRRPRAPGSASLMSRSSACISDSSPGTHRRLALGGGRPGIGQIQAGAAGAGPCCGRRCCSARGVNAGDHRRQRWRCWRASR